MNEPSPRPPRRAHEIDHRVFGDDMQFVEVELDPGEAVIAEAGAMLLMEAGIGLETRMGDGSQPDQGLMGKLFEGVKRKLTGESLFLTWFTNRGQGKRKVSFAAPYPGRIVPVDLRELGGELLCQRDSFLCAAMGTQVGIAFTQRLGAGLFGGEGFILQKLNGDGQAFLHAGGTVFERTLAAGETLRVDTGCLVAFQPSVRYDIEMVKGIGSILFGGEGLFLATLTGPGRVWLQSLPFSRLAARVYAAMPRGGGKQVDAGGVLGGLGGLLDGD